MNRVVRIPGPSCTAKRLISKNTTVDIKALIRIIAETRGDSAEEETGAQGRPLTQW
jgi:hypothetical protein